MYKIDYFAFSGCIVEYHCRFPSMVIVNTNKSIYYYSIRGYAKKKK